MPYILSMVILGDHNVKELRFGNFPFELPRVKNSMSRLCTNLLGAPPPPRAQASRKHSELISFAL